MIFWPKLSVCEWANKSPNKVQNSVNKIELKIRRRREKNHFMCDHKIYYIGMIFFLVLPSLYCAFSSSKCRLWEESLEIESKFRKVWHKLSRYWIFWSKNLNFWHDFKAFLINLKKHLTMSTTVSNRSVNCYSFKLK